MRRTPEPSPSGAIVILRQMEKHEWLFTLPRITEEVDDRLEEGIDWIDADPNCAASIFLELIEEYPEHMDAYHHLALFQLGRLKEASRALNLAIKHWPLVATELLKTRHRMPRGTNERYVSLGGADQAYLVLAATGVVLDQDARCHRVLEAEMARKPPKQQLITP